jgi:HEPN domain-containing protein
MNREPTKDLRRIVEAGLECSPRSYRRAATQRLDTARFLLKNSKYYLDAVYLAGYAAECSLKAVILDRTPKSKWAATCVEISSGAKAHNLDFLRGILRRTQGSIPPEVLKCLSAIRLAWMTNLRYVGVMIPSVEAEYFIEHVDSINEWAERGK